MPDQAIEAVTPFQRLTLLAVADLVDRGETPVRSYDVRRACNEHVEALSDVPFGGASRQEVIGALNALTEAGLLSEDEVRSPVGKWRPAYDVEEQPEEILAALGNDEHVGPAVSRMRDR